MGIANINCMHENAPQAINQNVHEAAGLTRILLPFAFFLYRENLENKTSKIYRKSQIAMPSADRSHVIVATNIFSRKNKDRNLLAQKK